MHKSKLTAVVTASLVLWLGASMPSAAGLYKWVDENGEVHYGDAIPPDQMSSEHRELNEQGVTVNKVNRARTKEEIAAEKARAEQEKRQREEAAAQATMRATRDRVLLDTYLTEQDMIDARDRKIAAIEGTIQITERSLKSAETTLQTFAQDAKDHEPGTPAHDKAQTKIKEAQDQVAALQRFIGERRQEQAALRAQFEADLKRFRELKASAN